ncbi:MAG: ribonuclease HII [Chloroflexi bacterium RBG_16_48_8]|nr:MAG: ribonuclease HII [Chloroflexi bacterium RBG_16_48_8]
MPPLRNRRQRPSLAHEYELRDTGHLHIAGVDEAGRGAWAGPVIAAAVILPLTDFNLARSLDDVRDSKLMTPAQRSATYVRIQVIALSIGLGNASSEEVDKLGVIGATHQAMHRALRALSIPPQHVLIDHLELPNLTIAQTPLTKGDRDVLSIAAASVIAKVARDEIMKELDSVYPGYGFSHHKGYGTVQHRRALKQLGPTLIHRKTFAPVANQIIQASSM